jgi:hypothetical protein
VSWHEPSHRNQRIERVWRDCARSVLKLFSKVFTHLEEREKSLDYADPLCVICLHYVFVPRIQQMLDEWVTSWNSHPIEGCSNFSPLQLRESGFLQRYGSESQFVRDVFDGPLPTGTNEDEYGVECDDADAEECEENTGSTVTIPQCASSLPPVRMERILQLLQDINPLENDNNYGISLYKRCLELARSVQ